MSLAIGLLVVQAERLVVHVANDDELLIYDTSENVFKVDKNVLIGNNS